MSKVSELLEQLHQKHDEVAESFRVKSILGEKVQRLGACQDLLGGRIWIKVCEMNVAGKPLYSNDTARKAAVAELLSDPKSDCKVQVDAGVLGRLSEALRRYEYLSYADYAGVEILGKVLEESPKADPSSEVPYYSLNYSEISSILQFAERLKVEASIELETRQLGVYGYKALISEALVDASAQKAAGSGAVSDVL